MSNKEMALHLLELLPEYKLRYVVAYLQGLSADEAEDDAFCAQLVDEYENSTDKGDFVSFEDAAVMCGVNLKSGRYLQVSVSGEADNLQGANWK